MPETLGVVLEKIAFDKRQQIDHTLDVIETNKLHLLELIGEVVGAIEPYEGGIYKLSGTPIAPKGHELIENWEMEVVKAGFAIPKEFEHFGLLAIVRAKKTNVENGAVYTFDPYQDRSFDIQPIDSVE